jgi:acyl-CoA synthetase (AMP-forming)/AMP-acid ligase II
MLSVGERRVELPQVASSDLALIQYTSGSTGDPKGWPSAAPGHGQHRLHGTGGAGGQLRPVRVLALPLYHDMGLIAVWQAPMVVGLPLVIISPLAFLADPASWLGAISAHRATLSAGPNFAYQARVDRIDDAVLDRLDLSTPGTIIKTSGGKIRRAATRDGLAAGKLGRSPNHLWVQLARLAA